MIRVYNKTNIAIVLESLNLEIKPNSYAFIKNLTTDLNKYISKNMVNIKIEDSSHDVKEEVVNTSKRSKKKVEEIKDSNIIESSDIEIIKEEGE